MQAYTGSDLDYCINILALLPLTLIIVARCPPPHSPPSSSSSVTSINKTRGLIYSVSYFIHVRLGFFLHFMFRRMLLGSECNHHRGMYDHPRTWSTSNLTRTLNPVRPRVFTINARRAQRTCSNTSLLLFQPMANVGTPPLPAR